MKKMKKLLSPLLIALLIISLSMTGFAYNIGDVIGKTLTTDIVAQINGYDIPSYNYNGYTYIVAEDLANYGFSVSYNNATRTLGIKRNYAVTQLNTTYKKPAVSAADVGKVAFNILYTDITTYIEDTYVNSYNINGQTIIAFDSLASFGACAWDNNTRKITLDIPGIAKKATTPTSGNYYPGTDIPTFTSVNGVPLKDYDTLSDGSPLYMYSYTNAEDVGDYWRALVNCGWSKFKGDDTSTTNKFESSFVKGSDLLILNVYFDFNEVWITFTK